MGDSLRQGELLNGYSITNEGAAAMAKIHQKPKVYNLSRFLKFS
jgi:hypothetical protein